MENLDRHRLELIGITYNQIESGVYAVVLKETDGDRRIPIIIGYPEAQSIECKLQDIPTPRPLTHDMMINFMGAFGISLREIEIRKLHNGIFAANLIFTDGNITRIVDSRSSDAIALAIRAGAPIYTSEDVLSEAGFLPEEPSRKTRPVRSSDRSSSQRPAADTSKKSEEDISKQSVKDLEQRMQRAAEQEDYELAARIKAELDRRNSED